LNLSASPVRPVTQQPQAPTGRPTSVRHVAGGDHVDRRHSNEQLTGTALWRRTRRRGRRPCSAHRGGSPSGPRRRCRPTRWRRPRWRRTRPAGDRPGRRARPCDQPDGVPLDSGGAGGEHDRVVVVDVVPVGATCGRPSRRVGGQHRGTPRRPQELPQLGFVHGRRRHLSPHLPCGLSCRGTASRACDRTGSPTSQAAVVAQPSARRPGPARRARRSRATSAVTTRRPLADPVRGTDIPRDAVVSRMPGDDRGSYRRPRSVAAPNGRGADPAGERLADADHPPMEEDDE
jgi:hypothetical protein